MKDSFKRSKVDTTLKEDVGHPTQSEYVYDNAVGESADCAMQLELRFLVQSLQMIEIEEGIQVSQSASSQKWPGWKSGHYSHFLDVL